MLGKLNEVPLSHKIFSPTRRVGYLCLVPRATLSSYFTDGIETLVELVDQIVINMEPLLVALTRMYIR